MHPTLRQKIIELRESGETDSLRILEALKAPSRTDSTYQVARPQYPYEARLYSLLVPTVVTLDEIVSYQGDKVLYVSAKLKQMFAAADIENKLNILALSSEVQNAFLEVRESGSKAFSDPDFMRPTVAVDKIENGPSWLEENGFSVSEEEIREVT